MKKNLTLLMMLAAFVGILSAQSGPKFNYQAVVRNADTLVYNQDMTVTLTVTDGTLTYTQTDSVTSNKNGFISVVVGGSNSNAIASGTNNNFNPGNNQNIVYPGSNQNDVLKRIDWSKANITAEFKYVDTTAHETITLKSNMTVKPVPYAFQAGSALLTTERIASYMKNTLDSEGAKSILNALVIDNDNLQQALEDTIEDYLMANKDIALEVAKAYLDSLKVADVQEAYNRLEGNQIATAKLKELVKDFVIQHRDMAKELTIWYLNHADSDDIARAYTTMQEIPSETKQAFKNRVINYVKANPALVEEFGLYLIHNVTAQETAQAYAYFEQTNTNHVNEQLRDSLNIYIEKYLTAHPTLDGTVDSQKVANAINNYLANHNVVKKCSTADVCVIDSLYKTYQQQNGGNNNNNNNNNTVDCPSFSQTDYIVDYGNQVELTSKISLSSFVLTNVNIHFVVTIHYDGENDQPQPFDLPAEYGNGSVNAALDWSYYNLGSATSIEFYPEINDLPCGDSNSTHDIEESDTPTFIPLI